ncbi:MAG: hypothetical protein ACRDT4_03765 [Micromonosporaceae bacterium]
MQLSARMVPWVRAWRAGLVPYDDVAGRVSGGDEHLCRDLPGTWRDVPLAEGLASFSSLGPDQVRLVLPAPGDPRGLPGPGAFTGAALLRGEGVIAGGYGLVPELTEHRSGSGDVWHTVTWHGFAFDAEPAPPPDAPSTAEAEADLSTALAETTDTLASLDVARWRPELGEALTALRRTGDVTELPPGYDPRSRRLYARASVLRRVLALAAEDPIGGAVNAYEAQQRAAALRPLDTACRRAMMAACNTPLHT